MVSFDLIDVHSAPTDHHTLAPSPSQSLSPSAPPPLPSPLDTTTIFASSSSLSFDTIDAPTFGCLLAASFGACLISGLTFQWVIEKGLFRKKSMLEKANQYNVLVAVAALAAFLQTIACFVNALLHEPNIFLSLFILLTWVLMTHASVVIVARKVSLTYNNAEQAWQRLLSINAAMMVVSILVCVVSLGAQYKDSNETLQDMNEILQPLQIALWGALEFVLSLLFILQMRKYYWLAVERQGILVLLVVALCDIGLVCLQQTQGGRTTACVRGFVYALRIRLELEVLSSMVTYIQNKRKEVVYMAHQHSKRRRLLAKRRGGKSGSSDGLLEDDDDASVAGSIFNLKRFRRRKNHNGGDLDDDDSCDDQSIFNAFRRKRRKGNDKDIQHDDEDDNDDDSVTSHMSVFQRLPHATDFSNIFQRNFLQDFTAATQNSGNFLSSSLTSLNKKLASIRSITSPGGKTRKANSTQATARNSTSSCEIPIQGMEIKVAPSSAMLFPESSQFSETLHVMEEGTEHPCREDISSSLLDVPGEESEQALPFRSNGFRTPISDLGLSCSSDSDSDSDTPDDAAQVGQSCKQPEIPTISDRLQTDNDQSSSEDGIDDEDDDDGCMLFGIPRQSFGVKDRSNMNLEMEDSEQEEDLAPFGIPREFCKSKPRTNNPDVPARRRCASSNNRPLLALPVGTSENALRESRLELIGRRDRSRRESKVESAELIAALDKLESMDCLPKKQNK